MPTEDFYTHQGPNLAQMRPELRRGVCAAMSYDWIRVVSTGLNYGPNLYGGISQNVMSLQRGGQAHIAAGKSWTDNLTATAKTDGFTSVTWTKWFASAPNDILQFTHFDRVQMQKDVNKADFVHYDFYGDGGGHAVAFKVNSAPYLFFDPNFGQVSDNDLSALGAWASNFINKKYPKLQKNGFSGGFTGKANANFARPRN